MRAAGAPCRDRLASPAWYLAVGLSRGRIVACAPTLHWLRPGGCRVGSVAARRGTKGGCASGLRESGRLGRAALKGDHSEHQQAFHFQFGVHASRATTRQRKFHGPVLNDRACPPINVRRQSLGAGYQGRGYHAGYHGNGPLVRWRRRFPRPVSTKISTETRLRASCGAGCHASLVVTESALSRWVWPLVARSR